MEIGHIDDTDPIGIIDALLTTSMHKISLVSHLLSKQRRTQLICLLAILISQFDL